MNKLTLATLAIAGGALLSACGGGDGDPSRPSFQTLTLSGTAATGAAISGANVTVTCRSGQGTATSDGNGAYTVSILGGQGPCLVTVNKPATATTPAVTLRSITTGTATTQTVNVTPLTNLLVNHLTANTTVGGTTVTDPVQWISKPAAQALLLDSTKLATEITTKFIPTIQALVGSAITIPVNTSFLTQSFTPDPNVSTTDKVLEVLKTTNVVTSTGLPTATTTQTIEALPATVLPEPPAASGLGGTAG